MNGNGIIMYESDSLAHYGVLGMKWGHRKQRPSRVGYRTLKKRNKQLYREGNEHFYNTKAGREYKQLVAKDANRFKAGNNRPYSDKDYYRQNELSVQAHDYANKYARDRIRQEYGNSRMSKRSRRKFFRYN